MCDDKNMKEQTWISFNAAVMIGIIGGVLGNLFVTSGFATAHYYNFNFSLLDYPAVVVIFIASTILLFIIAVIIGYNLKEYLR